MPKTETTEQPDMMAAFLELMKGQQALLEKMGANQKPYEPDFGDPAFQERLRAEGHFDTFPIPVYQNGRQCEAKGIPVETRERAAALAAGTFLNGKVTVDRTDKYVHLKYKSMTVEDRMRQPWTSFEDLIDRIWKEQHAA